MAPFQATLSIKGVYSSTVGRGHAVGMESAGLYLNGKNKVDYCNDISCMQDKQRKQVGWQNMPCKILNGQLPM